VATTGCCFCRAAGLRARANRSRPIRVSKYSLGSACHRSTARGRRCIRIARRATNRDTDSNTDQHANRDDAADSSQSRRQRSVQRQSAVYEHALQRWCVCRAQTRARRVAPHRVPPWRGAAVDWPLVSAARGTTPVKPDRFPFRKFSATSGAHTVSRSARRRPPPPAGRRAGVLPRRRRRARPRKWSLQHRAVRRHDAEGPGGAGAAFAAPALASEFHARSRNGVLLHASLTPCAARVGARATRHCPRATAPEGRDRQPTSRVPALHGRAKTRRPLRNRPCRRRSRYCRLRD
jgi:hypothetical protein